MRPRLVAAGDENFPIWRINLGSFMVKNDHRSSEIRSLSKKFLYPFWVENLRSFRPFNSNNSGAPC
jgi:hypothetical protein